jgi:PAS domain S-box-containing protein
MYKILIVEDTQVIREEIYDILSLEGYTILQAENGDIGYKMATTILPDLIISDIFMPLLNGLKMFEKLKENKKTKSIPFIFLSDKDANKDIRSGMNAGAESYLIKPIHADELLEVVHRKLEKQQLVKKNIDQLIDENKFLLKEASRMAKNGYWTYDKQTNTTSWSKIVCEIFNIDPKLGASKSALFLNCLDQKSKKKFIKAKKNLFNNGDDYDIELRITNLKNEKCWIQEIGEPIYNDKKDIIGIRGVIRDITSLKNDQYELKRSNERYQFISRATNDAVWDWDLLNDSIYRNRDGFNKVFGFDDSINLKEMQMDDYVHPDDKNRIQKLLKEIIKDPDQNNFCFEYAFLSPNGNNLFIEDKGFILRSKNGVAKRIIGAATNVTKRNTFENSLQDAYANLQAVLESTADGILVVDDGKVINFNNKFIELWRLPESLLTKKDDEALLKFVTNQLVYPDKWMAKVRQLYAQPNANSLDNIELKDGRTFERYSQPKLMNGENKGRVWSFRNITERINTDKEKQQLFALIETSREIIAFGDLSGKPSFVNKAARELLGIDENTDLSKIHFFDFFAEKDKNRFPIESKKLFDEDGRWEKDTELINIKTNEKISVYMSAFVIRDNSTKKAIGFGSVSMDISEREKIKNELIVAKEEAEKLSGFKDQFLANMSHEIRTPLSGIIGFTKILLRGNITEKQKEQLTNIKISSDILLVVINDVLDLAKIEAGKMILEETELNVRHLINSILSTFELRLLEKEQTLHTHYDESIPESVLGDPVRINQILLNLVGNATKFTNKGGSINVHVKLLKQDDDTVIIEFIISDTGIGILEEKIKNIFDPFIQSNTNTSRIYGGSGLGLNIVKQLIDLMNGTITVKSQLHVGSTFTLNIPLKQTKKIKLEINKEICNDTKLELLAKLKGLKDIKVLIVDDMVINQLLVKTIIEDLGFETETAKNGKIAIDLIEKNNYNLILMDLQMPEMNGWEATEYIRNKMKLPKSATPIIALTADITEKNILKCQEIGMDAYVSKPINETDLLQNVTRLIIKKKKSTNNKIHKRMKFSNTDALKRTLHHKPKLIEEMLQLILKETPLAIEQINKFVTAADWSSVQGKIHYIKPTLDLIGLPKDILLTASKIQTYAKEEKKLDLIPNQLIKLEKALSQACLELEEELLLIKK